MSNENGNKLIAEFDGWVFIPESENKHTASHYERGNDWIDNDSVFKYHSSWSWLMPVVEKISKVVYEDGFEDNHRVFDTAYPRTFGMVNPDTNEFMVRINRCSLFEAPTLIEAAYQAVVDFIETLNKEQDVQVSDTTMLP